MDFLEEGAEDAFEVLEDEEEDDAGVATFEN